eukprot:GHVS01015483.1.p2 GENE.GHVS01015483.1~~GHVS01015483.1.p2  ORF type:complete len:113 (-),score=9.57 GHVS01015483.1:375-680(-)
MKLFLLITLMLPLMPIVFSEWVENIKAQAWKLEYGFQALDASAKEMERPEWIEAKDALDALAKKMKRREWIEAKAKWQNDRKQFEEDKEPLHISPATASSG